MSFDSDSDTALDNLSKRNTFDLSVDRGDVGPADSSLPDENQRRVLSNSPRHVRSYGSTGRESSVTALDTPLDRTASVGDQVSAVGADSIDGRSGGILRFTPSSHRSGTRNLTSDDDEQRLGTDELLFDVRVQGDAETTDDDRYVHSSTATITRSLNGGQFSAARARESVLERRKNALNTLFGVMPWKSQVRAKTVEERSPELKELLLDEDVVEKRRSMKIPFHFNVWNVMYVVLFGWLLSLFHLFLAFFLLITVVGFPYAKLSLKFAKFFIWPFGKYLVTFRGRERLHYEAEEEALLRRKINNAHDSSDVVQREPSQRPTGVLAIIRVSIWYFFFSLLVVPVHAFVMGFCWFLVLFVPMTKVSWRVIYYCYKSPSLIDIENDYPGAGREVLLCTFRAANFYYYKYQLFGMNIILVNLLPFVLISIVLGYILPLGGIDINPIILTCMSLLSIIPLSYYIGTAISSLSAQLGSFAAGAVLNASFGSLIELLVYFLAIYKGGLESLVQAGVTGSLLGVMLLLPGLSMVFGGIKHRTQRFNPAAAGVSMVLLILSVFGAFIPTIFYNIYGSSELICSDCGPDFSDSMDSSSMNDTSVDCKMCTWQPIPSLHVDPIFQNKTKPLMYMVAAILPLAYIIGLLFTLKTHSHIYDMPDDEEGGGGHDAPEWSKLQCVLILLAATILFALVSEELVDSLEPTLDAIGLDQTFAGLTIIALIPNTAEIVNAIQFALQNNFALSLEIGNAAATQITLIQMPVLVVIGAIISDGHSNPGFTLIFPVLDLVAVFVAMIIVNYISIEGKSNYFTGSALILVYALLVSAFYFVPPSDEGSSSSSDMSSNTSSDMSSSDAGSEMLLKLINW